MATPEQIQAAKDAGYTDEEIQAHLGKTATSPAVAAPAQTLNASPETQQQTSITEQPITGQAPIATQQTTTVIPQAEDPIAKARAAGYSEAEIQEYVKKTQAPHFAKPDKEFTADSDVPDLNGGHQKAEVSPENVIKYAHELGVDPKTREGMNAIAKRDLQERGLAWTAKSARDFFANAEEVYNVARPYSWFKSKFGGRAEQEYEQFKQQNVKSIIDEAAQRGLKLEYDGEHFFTRNAQGAPVKVEPGFLDSIGKSKYEMIGGVTGGILGAAATKAPQIANALSRLGPYGKIGAATIAGIGAIAGSIAGEQVDYLQARMAIQENFDAKLATEKAIGTAQFGIVGEVAGAAIAKVGVSAYRGIRGAFQSLVEGQRQGAYEALKRTLGNVTDDQVNQIINSWEQLNKQTAPGKTTAEKAMAILPTTQPGGDAIVAKAAARDISVATAVSNEVASRAKTLINEANSLTDDYAGERILKSLNDYTEQVKTNYGIVKQIGADLAPSDYKFNLQNLSIKPILEQKVASVTDQATRDSFIRTLENIDKATAPGARSFSDLLDLRSTLNKLKYKRKTLSEGDMEAINASLSEVDGEIDKVMTKAGAKDWLQDWKNVNATYHEYKLVQDNVLFKAVTKKGTTPDTIANAFVKYGTSIDDNFYTGINTYKQVLNKLPSKTREDVEGLIVQKLTEKRTTGVQGFNAIDFPQLAEDMGKFSFTTPQADRMKQAAQALSEVYKNDPKLMGLARMGQADFEQGMATSIEGKLKMSLLNKLWENVISNLPTKKGGELMLIRKTAKMLEDPLNTQTSKQVLTEIGNNQSELAKTITQLQAEIAKNKAAGTEYNSGRVQLWVDKAGKLYAKQQPKTAKATEVLASSRIIPQAEVMAKIGKDPRKLNAVDKIRLVKEGYQAAILEDGQVIKLN